jgi:hypothetical protein
MHDAGVSGYDHIRITLFLLFMLLSLSASKKSSNAIPEK